MTNTLELHLYMQADSCEAYHDPLTLVRRLAALPALQVPTPASGPAKDLAAAKELAAARAVKKAAAAASKTAKLANGSGISRNTSAVITPGEGGGMDALNLPSKTATQGVDLFEMDELTADNMRTMGILVSSKSQRDRERLKAPQRQVSSQGCSRVFIVKVLLSVSEFVNGKVLPSIFTFNRKLVTHWLDLASETCSNKNYLAEERYYGGAPFVRNNPATYWTEPHQLYTWWKNNVERKVRE
jgi:hypothetical protein